MMRSNSKFQERLSTPKAHLIALVMFLVLVFFTGGSSRDDMSSLVVLRPAAILFATYALLFTSRDRLVPYRSILALLVATICLIGLHLVPLPPGVWQGLPGRDIVVQLDQITGQSNAWRPLTLSPSKTWNALFSMSVPLAGLLLFANLEKQQVRTVWFALIVLAIISAIFGVLQSAGGSGSPAYLYRVTNRDFAVGLFANRNHLGVFLATMILASSWYFASARSRASQSVPTAAIALAGLLLFVPLIMLTGSRAGFGLGGIALLGALWLLSGAKLFDGDIRLGRKRSVSRKWILAAIGGALTILVALAVLFSRALVLDRFAGDEQLVELRALLLPFFGEMIGDFIPWGSGFGSFEYVFKIYEPIDTLGPQYVNLAHNDWAQWLIEGGVPAAILVLLFIVWLLREIVRTFSSGSPAVKPLRLMSTGVIAIWIVGSAFDYPLRTPIAMVCFLLACLTLSIADNTMADTKRPSKR